MIISVSNSKGGVGKTTLVANLAGFLADRGSKVLVVDADIQPTLSSYYPLNYQAKHGLRHLIMEAETADVVSKTSIDGLDLVFSDDPKGTLQNFILHTPDGRQRLDYTLGTLRDRYDHILIDTQGAVGPLQESAIYAGDIVVSPIRPDKVSSSEFKRGSVRVVAEARNMAPRIGLTVGPMYALLYGIDRTTDARTFVEALTALLDNSPQVDLLRTRVPATVAYKRAASLRMPAHRIDQVTHGKTPCAAEVMSSLVQELLETNAGGRR